MLPSLGFQVANGRSLEMRLDLALGVDSPGIRPWSKATLSPVERIDIFLRFKGWGVWNRWSVPFPRYDIYKLRSKTLYLLEWFFYESSRSFWRREYIDRARHNLLRDSSRYRVHYFPDHGLRFSIPGPRSIFDRGTPNLLLIAPKILMIFLPGLFQLSSLYWTRLHHSCKSPHSSFSYCQGWTQCNYLYQFISIDVLFSIQFWRVRNRCEYL